MTDIKQLLSTSIYNALVGANTPSGSNVFATMLDILNAIAGVNPAVAVQAATTAIIQDTPTYFNGVAGVGATLTAGATNTTLVVDGYTPVLLDRILVKNQASALQNGIYIVTQLGALGLPWILTRAVDFNSPLDINNTGSIPVVNGTVNSLTSLVVTSHVTSVGTNPITFTVFTLNPTTLAPLASPVFTGTPTAPTQTQANNTTDIATTAYVDQIDFSLYWLTAALNATPGFYRSLQTLGAAQVSI